jgi:small subunit ribosomal protein S2
MVDTCCDPTPIDFVIPANDDAATSIAIIMDIICAAITEGNAEHRQEREKNANAPKDNKDGDNENKKLRARKSTGARREYPAKEYPAKESPAVETAPAVE